MRAILTYHSVDDSGSVISVEPATLERHIRWLHSSPVRPVSVEDLLALPDTEDAVAITFDDGFVNFRTRAWPVLKEFAVPVTLFIVSGHAGGNNRWDEIPDPKVPELPLLDWDELGALADAGVELGSHTDTHPRLAELPPERIEEELVRSRELIRIRTGHVAGGLAYPYGNWDRCTATIAARHYRWACGTELAALDGEPVPHELPRLDVFYLRRPGMLERWGSRPFRARLWARGRARAIRARLNARWSGGAG